MALGLEGAYTPALARLICLEGGDQTSFPSCSDFGISLRREAIRRDLFSVEEIVLLIDGAPCLEKLGCYYFPGTVQIVDFYHALEHQQTLIEALWGKGDPARNKRRRHYWKNRLNSRAAENDLLPLVA